MHPLARTECHKTGLPTSMTLEETSIKKSKERATTNMHCGQQSEYLKSNETLCAQEWGKKLEQKLRKRTCCTLKSNKILQLSFGRTEATDS